MKMADSREDGDQKLQIFAYLDVGVTTLSITIGLYSWYCFIYRNKNFACQWPFKVCREFRISSHNLLNGRYILYITESTSKVKEESQKVLA